MGSFKVTFSTQFNSVIKDHDKTPPFTAVQGWALHENIDRSLLPRLVVVRLPGALRYLPVECHQVMKSDLTVVVYVSVLYPRCHQVQRESCFWPVVDDET